jgi:uncharacterized LabA/DUF88 family protein
MSQMNRPDFGPGTRVAVFIDFENVKRAVDDYFVNERVDLKRILDQVTQVTGGRIIVKRAYADWGQFRDYRSDLLDNATEPVQTFALTQRGKNGADIRIAIDVMDLALRQGDISHVTLVSGDSDFTPLVMKLRELGLQVIGVGVRSNTSTYLAKSCDRFLYYDDLREGRTELPPEAHGEQEMDAGRLLALALAEMGNRAVTGSALKTRMRQIDSRFDETRHGYTSFLDFLRAQDALIDLYKPAVGDITVAPKGMLAAQMPPLDEPPTLTFRSSAYTPYQPSGGIPYQAPPPIPIPGDGDGLYDEWLRDNNFRYVPAQERIEVIDATYHVFASSEEPLSLKEAKDRLHAWFEENRPSVPWESVNSTIYHLFYTWCFRFDRSDEGEGKQLWDRKTDFVDEIGSAEDLRERAERGIIRKLWEKDRGDLDALEVNAWLYDGNRERLSRVEEMIASVTAPGATLSSPRA